MTSFKTIVQIFGNNTGIVVPINYLEELQAGRKPSVLVCINDYEFESNVGSMKGEYLIPFSKAHREMSGIKGGDEVYVTLALQSGMRVINLPEYFKEKLVEKNLLDVFEAQSYSNRKEIVRQIMDAKKEETRYKRIGQIIDDLKLLLK